VKKAIESMKKGKTAGYSGLPIYLSKHLRESGVDMMHEILKRVWEEEQMSEEWEKKVSNVQFGLRSGKGATGAVFIIQLHNKHIEVQKDLLFAFIHLEKAYGRVHMDLVYWCMRRRRVQRS